MVMAERIRDILEKTRSIAVFGMSKDPGKTAHWVSEFLARKGYDIIPVNPGGDVIMKRRSYPDLQSVPKRIDVVLVFRRSEEALEPVVQAAGRKKERGDILAVWLQQGIRNEEARRLAEESGILFVQDRCMMHEWQMLNLMDG